MTSIVLDSSALLAVILSERGAAYVEKRMDGALISAVNLSEVYSRLCPTEVEELALDNLLSHLVIAPFDAGLARATGMLRPATKSLGLSLGDRACLALALREGAQTLTGDHAMAEAKVGVDVRMIR